MNTTLRRGAIAAIVFLASICSAQAQVTSDSRGSLVEWANAGMPDLIVIPFVAPEGDPGALTLYANRDDFDAVVDRQTCEDYEDTSIPPNSVAGIPGPVNSMTNVGIIMPGEIAEGIDIWDNPVTAGLAALGVGFFAADSNYLVANTFVADAEYLFDPAPNAVAMDLRSLLGAGTATVSFFNEADGLIGTVNGAALPASGDFIGVSAPEPIARVLVSDPGNGAEGGDNICWGNVVGGEGPARFQVTKDFNDDNPSEVDVVIQCNTGLPLMQPASISEGDDVTFVVGDFEDGAMNCVVTEVVPAGYTANYDNFFVNSGDSCSFEGVRTNSFNTCDITNTLNEVDVEVTKVWIDENPQFNPVNYAEASWSCSNVADVCMMEGFACPNSGDLQFLGNPATDGFSVFPSWDGGTVCTVSEVDITDGNVESDGSECVGVTVFPGAGASCTIYNTRLYAGIPTLSQYGLGVLVLLMLGVGLVGFRRFV